MTGALPSSEAAAVTQGQGQGHIREAAQEKKHRLREVRYPGQQGQQGEQRRHVHARRTRGRHHHRCDRQTRLDGPPAPPDEAGPEPEGHSVHRTHRDPPDAESPSLEQTPPHQDRPGTHRPDAPTVRRHHAARHPLKRLSRNGRGPRLQIHPLASPRCRNRSSAWWSYRTMNVPRREPHHRLLDGPRPPEPRCHVTGHDRRPRPAVEPVPSSPPTSASPHRPLRRKVVLDACRNGVRWGTPTRGGAAR